MASSVGSKTVKSKFPRSADKLYIWKKIRTHCHKKLKENRFQSTLTNYLMSWQSIAQLNMFFKHTERFWPYSAVDFKQTLWTVWNGSFQHLQISVILYLPPPQALHLSLLAPFISLPEQTVWKGWSWRRCSKRPSGLEAQVGGLKMGVQEPEHNQQWHKHDGCKPRQAKKKKKPEWSKWVNVINPAEFSMKLSDDPLTPSVGKTWVDLHFSFLHTFAWVYVSNWVTSVSGPASLT